MQYGFQRLVLLNSAGYSRAELPLDGAVSLVAPNNTGKTSLINALQYLLIIDRRRMDFGAHDVDKSRRFYFPHNSAYILLELSLPECGTVVLGCVGKGVSFDYEYFAYSGPLKIEEYCLPDGALVAQPQLASHLATHQRLVFSHSSSEFIDMVYGGRSRKTKGQQDFCVFRLEHAADAAAFQRVLTRTLRLDKLRSSEVKEYLLQIFRRDLPDAGIDFKAEWDKAFSELNSERSQYLAAVRLQTTLAELEQRYDERLVLRGKLLVFRPIIEKALSQWQQYYETRQIAIQEQQKHIQNSIHELRAENNQRVRQQVELEQEQSRLHQESERYVMLQQRFSLIRAKAILLKQRDQIQTERDDLVSRINQAQSREPKAIERDLNRVVLEIRQIEQEIRTQGNNLYQQLATHLEPMQLAVLNKLLAKSVLTLGEEAFKLDLSRLTAAMQKLDNSEFAFLGLKIDLGLLAPQYQQRTLADLEDLQQEYWQQQKQLKLQLETALALEKAHQQRMALEKQVQELDAELKDFAEMERLQHNNQQRQERMTQLQSILQQHILLLEQFDQRQEELNQKVLQLQQAGVTLQKQHQQIEGYRTQRQDMEGSLTWLADLQHKPWLAQQEFELEELPERLKTYLLDCRKLKELDEKIRWFLSEIHTGGLTKYQFAQESEAEIQRLVEFAHHLPQEAEALEKKARSAVVNVAASLRELRDGLHSFKRRMREFNRKISGRQLSDLAVFKIEPEDETVLVEAIDLLISTASTVEVGATFNLFNQQSVMDDDQLNRAKTLLIAEGNARQGLRVSDLFRLRFWVAKAHQEPEAFDDLDSAASNGTVLMAKLITGLAMLHLMQDQRRIIQGVCYLDEASALDAKNQRSLIETAADFGFSLIFASPAPLITARYCVPILQRPGGNVVSWNSKNILEPLNA